MSRTRAMDADRDLQCEAFLEPGYESLVASARAQGWKDDEIANAMLSIAQERIIGMRAEAWVGPAPRQPGDS